MSSYRFVVSLLVGLVAVLAVVPAAAQEADPVDVVERFYTWYLDYTGYNTETEEFRNAIVDGSYREREELSPALIAEIEAEDLRFADPFLCAQDTPHDIAFEAVTPQQVLVRQYFSGNPHPHTLTVELDANGLIADVTCMETVTARGTVRAFYYAYVEDRESVAIGSSPLLTDALNAQLSETLNNPILPGGADPVVCAQEHPRHAAVHLMFEDADTAAVIVRPYFDDGWQPVVVELVRNDRWQIAAIRCEVAPETVAAYLYSEFVRHRRYDLEQGIDRTPLVDWTPYPWADFMSEVLYNDLRAAYTSGEPHPADPFLCAQDLPERIQADGDGERIRISGLYPAGPDSYTSYDLAQVTMTQNARGIWQMTGFTCANAR